MSYASIVSEVTEGMDRKDREEWSAIFDRIYDLAFQEGYDEGYEDGKEIGESV